MVEIVSPNDIGINQVRADGLCIYCQLILHPGAKFELKHQPSWMALERSAATCSLCKLILRILAAEAVLQDVRLDVVRMSEVLDRLPEVQQLCNFAHSTAITVYLAFRDKDARGFSVSCASRGHRPRPRKARFGDWGATNNWETECPPYIYFCTEEFLGPLYQRDIWHSSSGFEVARLSQVSDWLAKCEENHPGCALLREDVNDLPSRVLDVGPSDGSLQPRLLIPNHQKARYAVLSHCWGSSMPLKTTGSSIGARINGIPLASLPKTFQDAVLIARTLKLRYLWIDSLCIVQDDPHDWENEAAKMSSIYANAHLTIVAEAAEDSNRGCVYEFIPTIHISYEDQMWHFRASSATGSHITEAPLRKRGWTLQETALSRRILNMGREQMAWKCLEYKDTEDGLFPDLQDDEFSTAKRLSLGENPRRCWTRLMQDYSSRSFTYAKDRLAALAGLSDIFQNHTGDISVLGLWKCYLLEDLLWQVRELREPSYVPNVPSWSWLALSGQFSPYDTYYKRKRVKTLKILDIQVSWIGPALTSELTHASLRVQGRLKLFRLKKMNVDDPRDNYFHLKSAIDERIYCGSCRIDTAQGSIDPLVWCLETLEVVVNNVVKALEDIHEILVLQQVSKEGNVFRRIGVGEIQRVSDWEWSRIDEDEKSTSAPAGLSFDDARVEEFLII